MTTPTPILSVLCIGLATRCHLLKRERDDALAAHRQAIAAENIWPPPKKDAS